MPIKEFLEGYSLYQKYKIDVPAYLNRFEKPTIHMYCGECESEQTFAMDNDYCNRSYMINSAGKVLNLDYLCAGCENFNRGFLIKISDNLDYLMKAGQYPEIDISVDKSVENVLGRHSKLFRKGLVCEAQGYGIGAYAYYRRIVESIIDNLLGDISELIDTEDKEKYMDVLEQTKQTRQTSEKISLVKDLLPLSLRPGGLNPLGTLYEILSEGIHNKPDDECIGIAKEINLILVYLIKQTSINTKEKKEFTESMKKLLDKKQKQD